MSAGTAFTPQSELSLDRPRVQVPERTLRRDRWWIEPAITLAVLLAFVIYATFRAFFGRDFYADPYLSPLYSPCLSSACGDAPHLSWLPTTRYVFTPAIWILVVPLGFRFTCYYYRKAYYRSFWASPPACAVSEPHKRYSGETRFPLVFQNVHRYFWYLGLALNVILTIDALIALDFGGRFGVGLGTVVLLLNAVLLWAYSLSCHSCRHILGGKLKNFSQHPLRYKFWIRVSRLNAKHMQIAWVSLVWVAFTDLYIYLVSAGVFTDPRWIS